MSWSHCKYNKNEWDIILTSLDINSFKSTFNYSLMLIKNNWQVRHITFTKNNKIISASQIFIKKKYSYFNFIYVPGGVEGIINDEIIEKLKNYIFKNFSMIKIVFLNLHNQNTDTIKFISWNKINYFRNFHLTAIKILPNLSDDIINHYTRNWRHNLKRSKKYNLDIINNNNPDYEELKNLIIQFEILKKISITQNFQEISNVFQFFKNNIIHLECRKNNKLIAVRSVIFFNNTAWDFLAISSSEARSSYATYLLMDNILKQLHVKKVRIYNLSGIDKHHNLGVYNFKKGLNPNEFQTLGDYFLSNFNILSLIFSVLINLKRAKNIFLK